MSARNFIAPLSLLSLSLSYPVSAQTKPEPTAPSASTNLLRRDKRLGIEIPGTATLLTSKEKSVRLGRLLSHITKRTRVGLTADYEGAVNASIFASFDKVKASDLMDGLAALWLMRWEVESSNTYRLIGRGSELDDAYLPEDDNEREKYAAGVEFMQGIGNLPKEGIGGDVLAGKKANVSDLPPALQQNLARVITATVKRANARGSKVSFPLQDLALARFSVETEPHKKDGFTTWFIKVGVKSWGQMGTSVTDYEQQKKKRGNKTDDSTYTPVKFALSQDKARELPELRRAIRLNLTNITIPEALKALHEKYNLDIIGDAPTPRPAGPNYPAVTIPKASVSISTETVAEAFDALVEAFPGSQWEYRPSKFFIFRAPNNPAIKATN